MAAPRSGFRLKSVADLQIWLQRDIGFRLQDETELVAHGGTALTLLGLKEASKDVDFAFRTKDDFDRLVALLQRIGYRVTMDLRPIPGEVLLRLENPSSVIDVVDLRFPTWNNWRLTQRVLEAGQIIPRGKARLVLPDRDAVFLFKTYPLRETDLEDLRTIIDRSRPNQQRVSDLFEEQDGLNRTELRQANVSYEPLFNILNLRARFAGSLSLLGDRHRGKVKRLAQFSMRRFEDLGLPISLGALVDRIRDPNRIVDWDEIIGADEDDLRERLVPDAR
jgi:hypothetical protein